MIYDILADYYDALLYDSEAIDAWYRFVHAHGKGSHLLELASGSGDLAYRLKQAGYAVTASDFSIAMRNRIQQKYPPLSVENYDLRTFEVPAPYDTLVCFCDSVNYLQDLDEFKRFIHHAYLALSEEGRLLFDMHSLDRLEEFKEPYIEEGVLDGVPYQWTIQAEDDTLQQHFAFWKDGFPQEEYHLQHVFNPIDIQTILEEEGFDVEFYTDFDKKGIDEGEKIFVIGRKTR